MKVKVTLVIDVPRWNKCSLDRDGVDPGEVVDWIASDVEVAIHESDLGERLIAVTAREV